MGFVTNELCIGIIDVPTTATISIYETKEKYLLSTEVLTQCSSNDSDVSQDAIKYLAGYVAFKSRLIDKRLGVRDETLNG